jgi:serine phosphatase RsbU (regulator of sigma subunit)
VNGTRILVVDDEPGMLRAVERVLADTHHVVGSRSSLAAVGLAAEFNPELAIVDIRMPELDGFELMARLKQRQPDLDVILMTGSLDDLDEKLVRAIRSPAFYFIQKPFDREVLRTLVDRCLELRWRREQNRRHVERLEHEIAEARKFQQSLLPDREAVVNRLAMTCRYHPWSGLGGDLYDYAAADADRTALLVADVSGHGASAAMLTSVVKSAFHAARVDGYDPRAVVHRAANAIAAFGPERFVTLITALASPAEGWIKYVNAGHPPAVLWSAHGDLVWLPGTGPLVSAALPASLWDVNEVPIRPGDQLLLYTDGIWDVLAGEDGSAQPALERALTHHRSGGAALVDAILADVHRQLTGRPQPDDITVLTARIRP